MLQVGAGRRKCKEAPEIHILSTAINMFTLVFMILFLGRLRSFVSAEVFVVLWWNLLKAFDELSSQNGHHVPLASVWTVAQ